MRRFLPQAVGFIAALVVSLLLAQVHPFGNAGPYAANSAETQIANRSSIPPQVQAILAAKCAACHSMQTPIPPYGRLAPASWLIERDIIHGREAMNFDQWDIYTPVLRRTIAAKIERDAKAREMPPLQYRVVHRNARLTEAETETLTAWAHATARLDSGLSVQVAVEGNPLRGKQLFQRRCTGCHALTENREGPRLQGVFGRASGTAPEFVYSAALRQAHISWDETALDRWLTDPDLLIPGNEMDFLVPGPQDRRDLISFLRQASGK
ncbi:MAG: heme-binding domain-containing protein [Terracidiphilus sp.]|jgi:cytochrome c